jgi:hypothetical protein
MGQTSSPKQWGGSRSQGHGYQASSGLQGRCGEPYKVRTGRCPYNDESLIDFGGVSGDRTNVNEVIPCSNGSNYADVGSRDFDKIIAGVEVTTLPVTLASTVTELES